MFFRGTKKLAAAGANHIRAAWCLIRWNTLRIMYDLIFGIPAMSTRAFLFTTAIGVILPITEFVICFPNFNITAAMTFLKLFAAITLYVLPIRIIMLYSCFFEICAAMQANFMLFAACIRNELPIRIMMLGFSLLSIAFSCLASAHKCTGIILSDPVTPFMSKETSHANTLLFQPIFAYLTIAA
jgi:hypothetical protein